MSGASDRFEDLYVQHGPSILAYAVRRVGRDIAPDVVAETFAVAWRRFGDSPDEPLPWLYGIARKVIANQRRSTTRQLRLAARLAETESAALPPSSGEVVQALSSLPPADQELLMLIAWEGLRPSEAAVALGCSGNAVRIRLYRARRRLERALCAETRTRLNVRPGEAR